MPEGGAAAEFYDRSYGEAEDAQLARWRELGARGKAEHVVELAARASLGSARVAEIGCGEGALLAELARRGFGEELTGYDVSAVALERARARGIARVRALEAFDGERLPVEDGSFDLGILSHVLEHVPEPAALLREAARACRAVIVEVPLERNLSGRRAAKREVSSEIGHLQALDRGAVRALVAAAGLSVRAELLDPLPAEVHTFFARGRAARARALVKSGVRRGLFRLSPAAAERAFTLHYACACVPV